MTAMTVEYMCHSGSDLLVVDAARASFGKQSEWERQHFNPITGVEDVELRELSTKDEKLILFLAREGHVLPFRHPTITFRCKAPIFVARQLMKHQVGFSWSEESRRYIKTPPEFYWPDKWRKAADNVKQGSSDEEYIPTCWAKGYSSKDYTEQLEYLVRELVEAYESAVEDGLAPEQARMILPQNMMTTWVWTGTLLAWCNMLKLRLDSHTQKETRDFAEEVASQLQPLFPVSYRALMT